MKINYFLSAAVFFSITGSLHMLSNFLKTEASGDSIKSVRKLDVSKQAVIWAENQLKTMTLDEKIGQFFMVSAQSNASEDELLKIDDQIKKQHVGGIIFFQGEKVNLKKCIERFNSKSARPLLYAMDAEWGTKMRIFEGERYPYSYTIGATNDTVLTRKIAETLAAECRDMGIHLSFSPVADINNNPKNPVIGFRSFGGDKNLVSRHVEAFVKGMEENGVMSCVKHFPGHGNTDKDSHLELPIISATAASIKANELIPFEAGLNAGCPSLMMAHLKIPSLDPTGMPSSLSKTIIGEIIRNQMKYNGLVISDALNMKAVADLYGKTEVVVKAFEAGCDILLCPESVADAHQAIKEMVVNGSVSEDVINERCKRILIAKYKYAVDPQKNKTFSEEEKLQLKREIYEKATTVLTNESGLLPLSNLNKKIALVSIGSHSSTMSESMNLFADVSYFHYYSAAEAISKCDKDKLNDYDIIVTTLHANSVKSKSGFGFDPLWRLWVDALPNDKKNILVLFGNPLLLVDETDMENVDALLVGYENQPESHLAVAQLIFGAIPSEGKLPFSVNEKFPIAHGITFPWSGRLKFSSPEELGIKREKLESIDSIVQLGLNKGAFPGCQIVVAIHGKIIYQKSFGTMEFNSSDSVKNSDVYDIASVTKIAASTAGLMKLQTNNKISLDKTLNDYLPALVKGNIAYGSIKIREMMTHQAGFKPFIQFYKETINNGKPDSRYYSSTSNINYNVPVAKDLFMRNDHIDTMYKRILQSPIGAKSYEYSDIGYYFVKKIIEAQTGTSFADYLMESFYLPMGLRTMRYLPLNYFPLDRIAPTQNDKEFRGQLIRGYVHDPGAAMIGGVGGHAGIFSNASDLAAIMQLFLNKGIYGNVRYIDSAVVNEYTQAQYNGNRRGVGFDRPKSNGGGTCHEMASQSSFGHSGFTGTLAWADPEYGINYVFLSNRVCPDQENWKIKEMNIRTEIQRVIYEAVLKK